MYVHVELDSEKVAKTKQQIFSELVYNLIKSGD